jgi:hypothetical protein
VDRAARELREAGAEVPEPRHYSEYGQDYYATFFEDPDGIRLEVMNFRELRRKLMYDWQARPTSRDVPELPASVGGSARDDPISRPLGASGGLFLLI